MKSSWLGLEIKSDILILLLITLRNLIFWLFSPAWSVIYDGQIQYEIKHNEKLKHEMEQEHKSSNWAILVIFSSDIEL